MIAYRTSRMESALQTLSTISELDAMLLECERAAKISSASLQEVFQRYRYIPPAGMPNDPFSEEYHTWQMEFFRHLSGREYNSVFEETKFDVAVALDRPIPFGNGNCQEVGDYLMLMGFLMRAMALPPKSRILEYGPGWGNTTVILAMMGHHVTAVDIEPRFCDLIRQRAERGNLDIDVVNSNFFWHEDQDQVFDAVVFFECFHHCADHMRLLKGLGRVVKPDGALYFGAEPINDDFPIPWGLRMDGAALWAIHGNGWMELGFSADYFREALRRTGWIGIESRPKDVPWSRTWTAKRRETWRQVFQASGSRLATQIGSRIDRGIALNGDQGVGLYGPYVSLPAGSWVASIHFAETVSGGATMDVCSCDGTVVNGVERFEGNGQDRQSVSIAFTLPIDTEQVEVRLFCDNGFRAIVESVELLPR